MSNIIKFDATNATQPKKSKEKKDFVPYISIRKTGTFTISQQTAEVIGLNKKDKLSIICTESEGFGKKQLDWFIVKDGISGLETKEIGLYKQMVFKHKDAASAIIEKHAKGDPKKSYTAMLSQNTIEIGGMEGWAIITSSLK
jgi:hypothetical protein